MDEHFFRIEHGLLKSEVFRSLSGSAVKVYLVVGMHADFTTGWAYPSVRTIARQTGMCRQTILDAIDELRAGGLLELHKVAGRSTAYRVVRGGFAAPSTPSRRRRRNVRDRTPETDVNPTKANQERADTKPERPISNAERSDVPSIGEVGGLDSWEDAAQSLGHAGLEIRPKREPGTRDKTTTGLEVLPGQPIRLLPEGVLFVAVEDAVRLLKANGFSNSVAKRIAEHPKNEVVAKTLLNVLHLKSLGKLKNPAGYIVAGLKEEYEPLPAVAKRLEERRREFDAMRLQAEAAEVARRRKRQLEEEEEEINRVLGALPADVREDLQRRAEAELPPRLLRRKRALDNPVVRLRIYELAVGEGWGELDAGADSKPSAGSA